MGEEDKKQNLDCSLTPRSELRVPSSKQKVLIADDRKENLVALRHVLRDVDAEIVAATSGNEALAATLEHDFAVAILDVMMPGMNGYELAELLRGDKKTEVIPIVFVTASHADEQHMFKGYEVGGIDYIVKPYAPEVMVGKVRMFLELARHRQEQQRHRERLETLVAERTRELSERVKELRCLYRVSTLVAEPGRSVEDVFRTSVSLIPAALQYPEIACARITFEGREFTTANFRETARKLAADIVVSGKAEGSVEVFYLKGMPEVEEEPFLREERELVEDLARQLGVMMERQRAEARVQRERQRFNEILEKLPVMICLLTPDHHVPFANRCFREHFGESHDRRCFEYIFHRTEPCPECQAFTPLKTHVPHHWEGVAPNGSYLDIHNFPFADVDGSPLILEMDIDITDRKRAEEALASSEARFRSFFEGAPDYCYMLAPDGRILDVNKAALAALGYDKSELVGQPVRQIYAPESQHAVEQALDEWRRTGSIEGRELQIISKQGAQRSVILDVASVRNEEGALLYSISTQRDIAERKKLEAQFIQAQKMESVGRLAGGVAHDFNNMLSVILGRAQLCLDTVDPAQPLHGDLQEILKAARRSADLTRQLLAFARKQPAAPKVLDLNETVEGMLKMLRRLVGEDIDIAWLPGHGLWPVMIDPAQIDQILANLAVNARDAIAGTGKLTIETEKVVFDESYCASHVGMVPGEYAMLAVSDDGCGMEKGVLEHVFEPFFTTKAAGQGTGLGLATVFGIVKQNEGFINVYSEPGEGSTFKIYLPRHQGKAGTLSPNEAEAPPRGGTETLLLVEDETAILQVGKRMLERLGYTVLTASAPGEAIRIAEQHAGVIHALITDVVMPEMSGRELADRLSSSRPTLKQLFMSGYTDNAVAHRGVLQEGVHFLQKPFSLRDMAAKVREALEGK
ncbi:MAG: response regulator [Acidobacteriota bacterium]